MLLDGGCTLRCAAHAVLRQHASELRCLQLRRRTLLFSPPCPGLPGPASHRLISDPKSASERRMASCADLLITSTVMFWQLYPFK